MKQLGHTYVFHYQIIAACLMTVISVADIVEQGGFSWSLAPGIGVSALLWWSLVHLHQVCRILADDESIQIKNQVYPFTSLQWDGKSVLNCDGKKLLTSFLTPKSILEICASKCRRV